MIDMSDKKRLRVLSGIQPTGELTGGYDIIKGERIKIKGYLEDFALTKSEADELIMSEFLEISLIWRIFSCDYL